VIQLIWNNYTVAMKSPEFGDSISVKTNVVLKRSYNNTPYTFKEPDDLRIRNFSFQKLSRIQVRNFWQIMRASKGRDITLIDHNNERWHGTITTTPISTSHDGINNSSVTFAFEGYKVEIN
jgi:hypothetical protein